MNMLLFPDAETLSPRLQWLRANGDAFTRKYDAVNPHGGDRLWICCNRAMTVIGFGDDERDAEMNYAKRTGVRHWALSAWNAAMDSLDE